LLTLQSKLLSAFTGEVASEIGAVMELNASQQLRHKATEKNKRHGQNNPNIVMVLQNRNEKDVAVTGQKQSVTSSKSQ
jgi:hypothetical protein